MPSKFKVQSLSPFLRPLYQKWSQPEATEEQIVQDFREILDRDFDRLDATDYEDGCHFSDAGGGYYFTYVPQAYFRKKQSDFIYAAIFEVTHTAPKPSPYVSKNETYYRLYDFSNEATHPEYGILKHRNPGEMLSCPVPNGAPHVAVAENGLIMLRPVNSGEDAIDCMRHAPVLKL